MVLKKEPSTPVRIGLSSTNKYLNFMVLHFLFTILYFMINFTIGYIYT